MDKDSISKIIQPNFLALLFGFILILPVSNFLDLSYGLVISILLGIILMLVFHFYPLLSSVDLSFSQVLSLGLYASSPTLFWIYSNKFLGMSIDYLSSMARDITIFETQMNPSFYPMESLALVLGGLILVCFLLVQNEFRRLQPLEFYIGIPLGIVAVFLKEIIVDNVLAIPSLAASVKLIFIGTLVGLFLALLIGFFLRKCVASAFGISAFLLSYLLLVTEGFSFLELSPGAQIPFFFFGGAVVAGILLLQDNLTLILDPRTYSSFKRQEIIDAAISFGSIILLVALTVNISMVPIISQNIPQTLSIIILVTVFFWGFKLSQEAMKPSVQERRTAALAYLAFLPFILYLFLRVLYLQHDPDPVMQNRWEIKFDFMDKVNTFKINPWPMEVVANFDERWMFLKAAIINSIRVTLLSIVLCLILGTIVGVTRLSSNKLASTMATVYVEVFRNLPLAVLLFLIATQYGIQAPLFIDETFLFGGAVFFSNQGIWFVTVESYPRLVMGLVALGILRAGLRLTDRIEPRIISRPSTPVEHVRRPFSALGWRFEAFASDLLLIAAAVVFLVFLVPFVSTNGGGLGAALALALLVYALSIISKVDDDGMNSLQIDDSESGLRKRFSIWIGAFSIAAGIALSKGISWPEYVKDWNGDGVIDAPGSWHIAEGTGFEITPFFLAMMLGLTLFTASTVAEIVRGSIQALPRGQVEAAISLSLNPFQRLRLVILPQALRSMVPLLNNQFMNVWKNSSLAVIVAYSDIFYVILVMMNNVGKLIPLFILLLITYQVGSLAISIVMNWYNSRVTSVKI
jgi:His/Glu/Gln/Arg/opine family amino acid ABC transporter permease subunit